MSKFDLLSPARTIGMYRYYVIKNVEYAVTKCEEAKQKALAFTNREEYLEFVAEWKALYKAMTEEVRTNRRLAREGLPGEWHISGNCRDTRWAMMQLRMEAKERGKQAKAQPLTQ